MTIFEYFLKQHAVLPSFPGPDETLCLPSTGQSVGFLVFQITALKIKYNPFAKAFLDAKER